MTFRFSIDRGGTFTDVYAECPDGSVVVRKLLSVDQAYSDAPREGIRRILEEKTGKPHPADQPLDASLISTIRMGTTVATNALLERKGEPMALIITEGFRDLLHIGNQSRPDIFDLTVNAPEVLYDVVVEAPERIVLQEDGEFQASTGERLHVERPLKEEALRRELKRVLDDGIRSLAVSLIHSYLYPEHERRVGAIAKELGFEHVSLSSDLMKMARIVPRGYTACADAYLTPSITRYVQSFAAGFKDDLKGVNVLFMQSDGGLTPVETFSGSRAIMSGPAGGVVGAATTAYKYKSPRRPADAPPSPVVGFDMGGTSTDVSRFGGVYEHLFETTVAGVTIQAPQLDITTVAAGGGSRLFFRAGMFVVGPESAGADPGPVCYRKGGYLTITDANLVLGRLRAEDFPSIFGPNNDQPLDVDAAVKAFNELTKEINNFLQSEAKSKGQDPKFMSMQEVALGFIDVANETMCRPIRSLTQARGFDTSSHTLSCFGGAGGQHACAIAQSLGVSRIHISKYAGILSAYGIATADVVAEAQAPAAEEYSAEKEDLDRVWKRLQELIETAADKLRKQGFKDEQIEVLTYLNMRYHKTDCSLWTQPSSIHQVALSDLNKIKEKVFSGGFKASFEEQHNREFGFIMSERSIIIDDLRVRGVGITKAAKADSGDKGSPNEEKVTQEIYFRGIGAKKVSVVPWDSIKQGDVVDGPVLITADTSTILVEPDCSAGLTADGDLEIVVGEGKPRAMTTELNAIHLSVFQHRFMSIAEQMGRTLERTSTSTNIKERLDFSCALFSPDGGLVANAPHIPVHLGAMQEAVRYQIDVVGKDLKPGDVLVSNHPAAGGSHLPDITVITPVFRDDGSGPVFWVASRGHHADIGGITPGSMPPHSKSLVEEGAAIKSFKLVEGGRFQEDGITELLMEPGKHKGSSGTRNLTDNLSDLRAQVAANNRGIYLVRDLMQDVGEDVVIAYMHHIQKNAEHAVRDMLKDKAQEAIKETGEAVLRGLDYMDDGTPIQLTVTLNSKTGQAHFDFEGTGCQVFGNCNAPRAVAYSAVIYCLRCMVGHDIPLNQGCLAPVTINIPQGSILWPSDDAAVVGGNVLTSQRCVDVILHAFGAAANSQGCMNNLTFGDASVGYYETICGGAGAGPSWHGRSGVHTHMTNTRITDVEILERRYPVVVDRFSLRANSGGQGLYVGGDGVVRVLRFLRPMTVSILSERRSFRPQGLKGGFQGHPGFNYWQKPDGRCINLGGKCTVDVEAGDRIRIITPGGGGYGPKDSN